jgi:hypothetical protein
LLLLSLNMVCHLLLRACCRVESFLVQHDVSQSNCCCIQTRGCAAAAAAKQQLRLRVACC